MIFENLTQPVPTIEPSAIAARRMAATVSPVVTSRGAAVAVKNKNVWVFKYFSKRQSFRCLAF